MDKDKARRYFRIYRELDNILGRVQWDKSLFLSAIGKKLSQFRDEYSTLIGLPPDTDEEAAVAHLTDSDFVQKTSKKVTTSRESQIQVYVSIYCAKGDKLAQWENVLATIDATIISRPIYQDEEHAKALVASKAKLVNEGYCAVWIDPTKIAKPFSGKNPQDKLGNDLLVLKRGAVHPENIERFVHMGHSYTWSEGKLIAKDVTE